MSESLKEKLERMTFVDSASCKSIDGITTKVTVSINGVSLFLDVLESKVKFESRDGELRGEILDSFLMEANIKDVQLYYLAAAIYRVITDDKIRLFEYKKSQ